MITPKAMRENARDNLRESLDRFRGPDGWCVIGSMGKDEFMQTIEDFVVAVINDEKKAKGAE